MGLFSFIKNAGAKLTRKKAAPKKEESTSSMLNNQKAALLKSMIENYDLGIDNLKVEVDGDKVNISGSAPSQAVKEKAILTVGNIHGVASVEDDIRVSFMARTAEAQQNAQAPVLKEAVFYTVVKGDTLGKIAKAHYGNAMKYPVIFEANKPMLSHPDKIYPGQTLRIPELNA